MGNGIRDDNIQSKMATSDSGWTKKHSAKGKDLRQQHKKVTWQDKLKTVNRGKSKIVKCGYKKA